METITKRKAGRPEGSVAYIGVKLSDLNKILQPDALVLCDRGYKLLIKMQGLSYVQPTKSDLDKLRSGGDDSNGVLEMRVFSFDNEEAAP